MLNAKLNRLQDIDYSFDVNPSVEAEFAVA